MALGPAIRRRRVAVERELSDERRRDEWRGAGEESAAGEFSHG